MGQVQLALADFDCAVNTLRITEENNPGENSAALASALHQVSSAPTQAAACKLTLLNHCIRRLFANFQHKYPTCY